MADGIVELVFHFGDPFLTHFADGTIATQPAGFAIAQSGKHILIQPTGKIGLISARFQPWGAYHFFDRSIREFADGIVEVEQLWGPDGSAVQERICHAASNRERYRILTDFLIEKLQKHHSGDFITHKVMQHIQASRGRLAIKELGSQTGLAERSLERRFLATAGISPKQFSRLTRFLCTCQFIRQQRRKNLTEVTYECGYYDQAHLIKEFREFAGMTPKEFFQSQDTSFFPVA